MIVVQFEVPGVPAPQGSVVRTKYGVRPDNPATRPWRTAVAWEATAAMKGDQPRAGAFHLSVIFTFPRPKNHYGTGRNAEVLKPTAPHWYASKPDSDKLLRAIGDSLTGIVVRDDSQFVMVGAQKCYGSPAALITVSELPARLGADFLADDPLWRLARPSASA